LDVHCKMTVYVAQSEAGEVIAEGSVPTSVEGFEQMLVCLDAPEGTRIGLETGTQAAWTSRLLASIGMEPVVIDAREVRIKARRIGQKSDRRDAFEICDGLRRGIYASIVYVPDKGIQRLRTILSRRRHFVRVCTSQVNAAKHLLRSVGLGSEAATLTSWAAWQKLLNKPGMAGLRNHLSMHARLWRMAFDNVQELEQELSDAATPYQDQIRLLMSVPGVGAVTATTVVAVLGDPERFVSSGHVASYLGLVPSTFDTGGRERHGRITKQGCPEMRALLCESAHHAARARHPLNPYWMQIAGKSGYRKAVVAVAHRLARILWQMWRHNERFDVRKLGVVAETRARTRTFHYRLRRTDEPVAAM
jgi:transposase